MEYDKQAKRIINETATESEADYRQKSLIRKLCKKYKNDEIFSERAAKQSYRKGVYANNSALLEEDLEDAVREAENYSKTSDYDS